MNSTATLETTTIQDTSEQSAVATRKMLPAGPFPRKYVHSVFDDLQHALQAAQALQMAGYAVEDIHVLESRDFVGAFEQRRQQQSSLSQDFLHFFLDDGFDDLYLREARRGHHILLVRLSAYEQMNKVRDLLIPHRAHLMRYADTWTVAHLIP